MFAVWDPINVNPAAWVLWAEGILAVLFLLAAVGSIDTSKPPPKE